MTTVEVYVSTGCAHENIRLYLKSWC